VNLDLQTKSGNLFFIDCLQQPQVALLDQSAPKTNTFSSLTGRILVAKHRWLSSLSQNPSRASRAPRFSVVIDDLSLLADVYAAGAASAALDTVCTLERLVQDPADMLGLSLPAPVLPSTLRLGSGSLLTVTSTTTPTSGFETLTSLGIQPPTVPPAPGLLIPLRQRDKPSAAQHLDVSVAEGGLAALLAHRAISGAGLTLELAPLRSGYSRDIACQLAVRRGARLDTLAATAAASAAATERGRGRAAADAAQGTLAVVYVGVAADGTLRCHGKG
jgi:hypothetical protein